MVRHQGESRTKKYAKRAAIGAGLGAAGLAGHSGLYAAYHAPRGGKLAAFGQGAKYAVRNPLKAAGYAYGDAKSAISSGYNRAKAAAHSGYGMASDKVVDWANRFRGLSTGKKVAAGLGAAGLAAGAAYGGYRLLRRKKGRR